MNTKIFDAIRFEVGDTVRSKNVEDRIKEPLVVAREELVKNLDGFTYSIIYFESNPNDFNVAYQFEPYDSKERKEYYRIWNEYKGISKIKKKAINKSKSKTKVFKL